MQQIQWDKMNQEIRHPNHYAKKLDMQGLIFLLVQLVLPGKIETCYVLGTLGASSVIDIMCKMKECPLM